MDGVDDGTRTHDDWNHNPGLYQLSYAHHRYSNYYNLTPDHIGRFRHTGIDFCESAPVWRARQGSNLLPSA